MKVVPTQNVNYIINKQWFYNYVIVISFNHLFCEGCEENSNLDFEPCLNFVHFPVGLFHLTRIHAWIVYEFNKTPLFYGSNFLVFRFLVGFGRLIPIEQCVSSIIYRTKIFDATTLPASLQQGFWWEVHPVAFWEFSINLSGRRVNE